MLSSQGFDLWADGYDQSVGLTDEEGGYPFAGYKELLNRIYQRVLTRKSPRVLDIGFGTGTLAARLYQQSCVIFGQDFSTRMLEAASAKMPKAQLYQGDFSRGLVPQLQGQTFDFITATYSLHHLTLEGKRDFLAQLRRGAQRPHGLEIRPLSLCRHGVFQAEALTGMAGKPKADEAQFFRRPDHFLRRIFSVAKGRMGMGVGQKTHSGFLLCFIVYRFWF